MKRKIQVPAGFPTLGEIVKAYGLRKAEVKAVEALLDRPLVRARKAAKTLTKSASLRVASKGRASSRTKTKTIRQMIAAKRSNSNHSR